MLDIKDIRANPEKVRAALKLKRMDVDVDRLLELDQALKEKRQRIQELKTEQNKVGKDIAQLKGDDKQSAIKQMKVLSDEAKALAETVQSEDEEFQTLMNRVPNFPDPEVPDGEDDQDNVEVRQWGDKPSFDFEVKDHVDLGQNLDLLDFQHASQVSGSRFYFLKGPLVLLEQAVLRYAIDIITERGFTIMAAPMLARYQAMYGTAYFPGGEEQAYSCRDDDLHLIGTSEVPVTSYHSGEILEASQLPIKMAGISACFRREAGAAGRDTRGFYRVHQFQKVEQVIVDVADEQRSRQHHEDIVSNAEAVLQGLNLPYRVVSVCGGDLGQPQAFKYDIETWMPSREAYCETHSASRFYTFQARRLNLRYRDEEGKVHFCHTLNNTVIASPRILIPLMECYQQKDGSIAVPEVLQAYTGFKSIDAQTLKAQA